MNKAIEAVFNKACETCDIVLIDTIFENLSEADKQQLVSNKIKKLNIYKLFIVGCKFYAIH